MLSRSPTPYDEPPARYAFIDELPRTTLLKIGRALRQRD
jgi:hypothetical protein